MPSTLIEQILDINRQRSQEFRDTVDKRRKYRREHPTEIAATLCMDGRVNLSFVCRIPFGIIYPFRNIGGKYDLGWPLMRASLDEWEKYSYQKRHSALLVITYHWSEGDMQRGCAGFEHDKKEAIKHMLKLKEQVDMCYPNRIHTLLVGIETDSEAVVVHGEGDQNIDMRGLAFEATAASLRELLGAVLPSCPQNVREDIIPLLLGNARHVLDVRNENRRLDDFKHCERILAIGQGFDWLVNRNFALIIGPCDPVLSDSITTAANIIRTSWKEGRIPHSGVLFVSTPYRNPEDCLGAIEQSKYLAALAEVCIREKLPDMDNFFHPLICVMDYNTRELEVVRRAA